MTTSEFFVVRRPLLGLPPAQQGDNPDRASAYAVSAAHLYRYTQTEGPAYDLPMAVALLAASEQVALDPAHHLLLGELGLDGTLRHTTGILPMVALARERGIGTVFVPAVNALEAALIREVAVVPVRTLAELVAHLRGELTIAPASSAEDLLESIIPTYPTDFSDVRGQEHVKRALEVAAGGHNVLTLCPQLCH